MTTLIKSAKESEIKTPIEIGSKVTFIGDLPGGYYDNYSGWSNRGSVYGTVIKKKLFIATVMKSGDSYKVAIKDITNIEDLF